MAYDTANCRKSRANIVQLLDARLTLTLNHFSGHKVLIDLGCQAFDMTCGGMLVLELFMANITRRVWRLTQQTAATRANIGSIT